MLFYLVSNQSVKYMPRYNLEIFFNANVTMIIIMIM